MVVIFQRGADVGKFLVDGGHVVLELGNWQSVADASHHVFTLGAEEIIAIELVGAIDWIAGKGNACTAVVTHVAKGDHLNVDGCAQVVVMPVALR